VNALQPRNFARVLVIVSFAGTMESTNQRDFRLWSK